jgi:hypothetical protein
MIHVVILPVFKHLKKMIQLEGKKGLSGGANVKND